MALLALLLLLAQNLGLGKQYPWVLLPFDLGRWLWVLASLGVAVLLAEQAGVLTLGGRWPVVRDWLLRVAAHRAFLVALVLGNVLFAVVSYHHFRRFGYAFPWAHFVALAAALAFVRRDRFWLSCGVSLALLIASMVHFPLAMQRSEMLPGIEIRWGELASGLSPDTMRTMPAAPAGSLAYLPGTFFSHAPAWLLGLDLRWNQWLWRIVWMLIVGLSLPRLPADSPWRTAAHVFVLNPYFNFRHDLYYEAFFASIAAYHAWPRGRWFTLPLMVWTRQSAWIMAPFLALDWLAVRGQEPGAGIARRPFGWRAAARQAGWLVLGMALVTGAVVAVLASTTSFSLFSRSVFLYQGMVKFDYTFALGPVADKLGAAAVLRPVQGVLMVALGLLALWRWRTGKFGRDVTEGIERLGLVALCVFLLFSPLIEGYLWFDPAFWMLAAYTLREAHRR